MASGHHHGMSDTLVLRQISRACSGYGSRAKLRTLEVSRLVTPTCCCNMQLNTKQALHIVVAVMMLQAARPDPASRAPHSAHQRNETRAGPCVELSMTKLILREYVAVHPRDTSSTRTVYTSTYFVNP